MSNNEQTAAAHEPQNLIETMIATLGAAIAAARADASDRASAALAVLLEQWRTQLEAASPAAVAPAQLIIALTAIFAVCEVRMVDTAPQRGIHIGGEASVAFDAALKLVCVYDLICGSRLGEDTMAALLGGFVTAAPDATPRGDRLH